MKILKFGGTSVANSTKFLEVSKIIEQEFQKEDLAIVLSAPAKVTNYLEQIIQNIKCNSPSDEIFHKLKKIFSEIICGIKNQKKNFPDKTITTYIINKFDYIQKNIKKTKKHNKCDQLYAKIISMGEIFSIKIMQNIFITKNIPTFLIDPKKIIIAKGDILNAQVNIEKSKLNIEKVNIPKKHLIFMPGFIAGNEQQELVTLGRNGSDYSAAILSVLLNAKVCQIWTDVNGIYTTDPNVISTARVLKHLSYNEAKALSFFGAKVLHPNTISPLSKNNIPCIIKNTKYPNESGTIINNNHPKKKTIKGITYLENIIMIKIKVVTPTTIHEITNQIFSVFLNNSVHILFQSYSKIKETIFFYITIKKNQQITLLHDQLKKKNNKIKNITIKKKIKIISIIGNTIKSNIKCKNKIFSILKYTNLNILNIHNEFSQYAISIVTDNNNIQENIKIIHDQIFHKKKIIEIFLIGIGGVGTALIQQVQKQKNILEQKNIQFKIYGIANSKYMLFNTHKIQLNNWKEQLYQKKEKFCIKKIIYNLKTAALYNPTIIDCTASQTIADCYDTILKNKIHIITPNKKFNSGSWKNYINIRKISDKVNKKFLYETNVSAGIPIIHTLKSLINAGDKLIKFKGILSGSLSFIFGKLEEGISISQATIMAQKLGFTEPNPRDDLSGIDVARKLLILAREIGYQLELHDIAITPIIPKEMMNIKKKEEFLSELSKLDKFFYEKYKIAKDKNQVLRLIGTIKKNGICQVKLTSVKKTDPLYTVKNGENALTIYSQYYNPIPLVLRGYGAGNNVTAAGIFSDLLQILS
ncbi:bifunctional aspartate kinase/homoserine dehydrogenase I [Buchnera aphidicola]|uniref:bifunctional aspartate kinase/homoserine dehydrogenase I n=1 Tax=Buchnera aphidicola TaxID=9 RepID=UPI0031B856A1